MAAAVGGKEHGAKPARKNSNPSRAKPRTKAKRTSGKNGEFDPLNGSL